MKRFHPMLALLALSAMACSRGGTADESATAVPLDVQGTVEWDSRERTYLLHLPPDAGRAPLPLVVVLHGGGQNAEGAARMTGFSQKADAEGFAVVYIRTARASWKTEF